MEIPERIKVGYNIERVEQYILNLFRCNKCRKYGHPEDICGEREVCSQHELNHHIKECKFLHKCDNCGGNHLVYIKSCESWKWDKEILAIKHKKHSLSWSMDEDHSIPKQSNKKEIPHTQERKYK